MTIWRRRSWMAIIAAVFALTFVLAGCGKSDNNQNNGGQPPETQGGQQNEQTETGSNETSGGEEKQYYVVMVTDVGGVNDNSFNQSAWEGLQQFESEYGAKVDYLQSQSDADYVPNLNQFVKNGADLTWGIGFLMGDAVKQVADQNPDAKLAIIDQVVDAPNVASVTFKEHEGSYLVGVVAGLMTKTNKIGFVGGMEIPVIKRFEAGFTAGVKAVNPDANVIINYTGAFDAPDQGKAAAATLYNDGADIIFHAAGATGDGVFNEGIERKKAGGDVWVIGVDKDQSITFGHDITLTSMMKRVDQAVVQVSADLVNGRFQPGLTELGLAENGVGLPENNPNVPEDVLKQVDEYAQKIVSGEIVVPSE
ncbi:Probable ABC transporter substrate binding protein YufN [Thermobacillus xylanilyticus]|uniref:Probable ABC transporter substrate binding protein YufN n=1 Tax=Thermobacillus xylanilyticus TaxID=76633 RepID=A0ABM8V104_THEXY|nr:BMP family ABC transporter substrate-binding protein [Thermobacillus xylanilyticus]CAG5080093.1 Probable ABC transporter substrate binding protein YufN [Thermobacillus xylanilyticus]